MEDADHIPLSASINPYYHSSLLCVGSSHIIYNLKSYFPLHLSLVVITFIPNQILVQFVYPYPSLASNRRSSLNILFHLTG